MKRFSLYLIFSFIVFYVNGQTMTTSFDVDGIKVILKPTEKEIIHVSMYYRGGLANYPAEKAGIENLALSSATECGTTKYEKNVFKDKEDAYGIAIGGSSSYDFGNISMNCIRKYFNEGWDLFSNAITSPVFEEREFMMLKDKVLASVKESESNPESHIENLSMKHAFAGTPYVLDPLGNEETLVKITAREAKEYYFNNLLNKRRMYLVIVGKVSKEEITGKIKKAFAAIPAKAYTLKPLKTPVFTSNSIVSEHRILATNYLTGAVDAPKMTSPDYVPYKLAITVLGDRLFKEIRIKRNLSYDPDAYSTTRQLPFGVMTASSTDPKAAAQVMIDEVKKLSSDGFYESELRSAKNGFITTNYMKEQSTGAIASSLGNAEIMGDWKLADEMPYRVTRVTLKELNNSMKYFNAIKWTYLGDKKLIEDGGQVFKTSISSSGPGN